MQGQDSIVTGKRLKILRVRADLIQTELGVRAGLNEESASLHTSIYEKKVHAPDFKLVCKLAAAHDIAKAYFYAVDDDLAELILQYHRFKNGNSNRALLLALNN